MIRKTLTKDNHIGVKTVDSNAILSGNTFSGNIKDIEED